MPRGSCRQSSLSAWKATALGLLVATALVGTTTSASDRDYHDSLVIEEHETVDATSLGISTAKLLKTFIVGPPASEPDLDVAVGRVTLTLPGRVFIDYVDCQDGGELVNSSTAAKIDVYGDSEEVVNDIEVFAYEWHDPSADVSISTKSFDDIANHPSGYLLIVISVFRRRQLQTISSDSELYGYTSEVVIGSNVILSSASAGISDANENFQATVYGPTSLYILSPSSPIDPSGFYAGLRSGAKLYIDAESITTSDTTKFQAGNSSEINVVVGTITAKSLTVTTHSTSPADAEDNSVCLYVTDAINVSGMMNIDPMGVAMSMRTAGSGPGNLFTYGKVQAPKRAPRDVTLQFVALAPSDDDGAASSSSPSSPSTGSSSSTADNAASGKMSATALLATMALLASSLLC